jgi:hypothetical protein
VSGTAQPHRPGIQLGALAARLEGHPPGATPCRPAPRFATQERRLVSDMSVDVMRIMSAIGFAIADACG